MRENYIQSCCAKKLSKNLYEQFNHFFKKLFKEMQDFQGMIWHVFSLNLFILEMTFRLLRVHTLKFQLQFRLSKLRNKMKVFSSSCKINCFHQKFGSQFLNKTYTSSSEKVVKTPLNNIKLQKTILGIHQTKQVKNNHLGS